MFESLIGLAAIVALVVILSRHQRRLGLMQRELDALRGLVVSRVPAAENAPEKVDVGEVPSIAASGRSEAQFPGPWSPDARTARAHQDGDAAPSPSDDATAMDVPVGPAAEIATATRRPDIETALGTRWAVWVGGLALGLGGLFLVRYTIEAGVFGPRARLSMAAALGLILVGGAEFIRRTGFRVPPAGAAGAYIPAILTAAGAFTLFGTVYAAHAVYGFIGPASAFILLGLIAVATIAAALVHGRALAGIGLLGALATPLLVSSQSPSDWALFGYLAIVLAATGFIARIRAWSLLMAAAFAGVGLWTLLYIGTTAGPDFRVVLFIGLVMLVVLVFAWFGRGGEADARRLDWPSVACGLFVAMSALALSRDPDFIPPAAVTSAALLIAAMLAAALARLRALALLHAAGAATVLAFLALVPLASLSMDGFGGYLDLGGVKPLALQGVSQTGDALMPRIGAPLGLLFILAGFWSARRWAASRPVEAACWAAWGVAAPLTILLSLWITFGDIDRDLAHAAVAALLMVVFAAGGEWIARAEQPPLKGGASVSFALAGAAVAALLLLHMAFGSGMTTVLLGAAAVIPAFATRWRIWPVFGWICVGAAIAVLARVAVDPTIVGAAFLERTPVFNWLLPGYGIPALAFTVSAGLLARTTDGRPRLAMEAAAALFCLLALAMLVRHAMHGGVIDSGALTLAEQAIYTLIALGASAILVAIDRRAPSSLLRYGSMAVGVISTACIAAQHFLWLNPLFTDESTGRIAVFNLLLLAYLLPALAAGALALYVRGKRPRWYSAMLALAAALLAFAYATLSLRRLFKGEFIALWSGMGQLETYSYSALWLAMGVAVLAVGVWLGSQVLRIASAALIAIAVLKVFLFDMSELEGVLRALSFIGLGAVLIGIGLFYQRLLGRAARRLPQAGE